ncbi:hypothetical protein [Idiomarina abyssalis]|uniref:hypothetical protein n=1 Tax=Idiomarina abyssalis TaxID=86102 RepID=UPI003A902718
MTEPDQSFYINFIGWALSLIGFLVIYALNVRTLNRAEISRQRESIKSQISELLAWLKDLHFDSKIENYTDYQLEEMMAAKVSQIEFRINSFNQFAGKNIFEIDKLSELEIAGTDTEASNDERNAMIYKSILQSYDLLEYTEIKFDEYINSTNKLMRFYMRYKNEIHGLALGLNLLALWWLSCTTLLPLE